MARQVDLVEQMIAQRVERPRHRPRGFQGARARRRQRPSRPASSSSTSTIGSMATCSRARGVRVPFVGPDNRERRGEGRRSTRDALEGRRRGRDHRGRAQRVQRRAAQAGVRGRDGSAPASRIVSSQTGELGDVAGEPGGGGDADVASRSEGAALRQRFDGARRGGRGARGRPRGQGRGRRLRQHLRGAARCSPTAAWSRPPISTAIGSRCTASTTRSRFCKTKATPADRETPVELVTR